MDIKKLRNEIVKVLEDKKAKDIEVIEVKEKTVLADYFIVASGSSNIQVKSLKDDVVYKIEENLDIKPKRQESDNRNRWNLLDYLDIVVHIFHQEEREFYQLEKLWHGPITRHIVDD